MEPVIVAAATPWGRAALSVVRLSGAGLDGVLDAIAEPMGGGPLSAAGRPRRVRLRDAGGVFDDGVLLQARGPATYTGEDTAEITCHGNPLVVERLLEAAVAAGARLAEPGEFTRRAVGNGKLDLVRAEAVLQVSEARTRRGLAVGRAGLDGALSDEIGTIRARLCAAAAELEARLDYPADELALVDDARLADELVRIGSRCRELAGTLKAGRVLVEGARVALVGAVNAGKSSLFNALLGRRRALVHDAPGTTRDVLEVATTFGGLAVTLLDTAGERVTSDPVEAAGLALARELVQDADLLLVVLRARPGGLDATERAILERTADQPRVLVHNGVDQPDRAPTPPGAVPAVAVTGEGVEEVKRAIAAALVGEEPGGSRLLIASARQRDLLLAVARAVDEALEALPVAGVAVAADAVSRGIEVVDALTGADAREAVLDELFSRFCIGK